MTAIRALDAINEMNQNSANSRWWIAPPAERRRRRGDPLRAALIADDLLAQIQQKAFDVLSDERRLIWIACWRPFALFPKSAPVISQHQPAANCQQVLTARKYCC